MISKNIKFIVICQYRLVSNSLCGLMQKFRQGTEVIEAANVDAALNIIANGEAIDMVLFYMALDNSGWDSLNRLRTGSPRVSLMVVADFTTNDEIRKAIYMGADGCVSTDFTWRTVTSVIKRVLAGEIVSPHTSYQVENDGLMAHVGIEHSPLDTDYHSNENHASAIQLTRRQEDVLRLIQIGNSNKQIARALSMALSTVKIHCAAIFKELGVSNRTQAAIGANVYFKESRM